MSKGWLRLILSPLLIPVSLVYGIVVLLRNILFDKQFLRSVQFDFPVISVGNITVGGTGKTPHVEYLLALLSDKYRTAMLSRGYKRKTSGFILAGEGAQPTEIGDEPFQVYSKFSNVSVAVDSNRVNGIKELKKSVKNLQAVVLDDAFQHRFVKAGLSIVLVDYTRPVFNDYLLPFGNLRESMRGLQRADIIVITKVPENIELEESDYWRKKLRLRAQQNLFFTNYEYQDMAPVYDKTSKEIKFSTLLKKSTKIILLTGIANPKPIEEYLNATGLISESIQYQDHHEYRQYDIKNILRKFDTICDENKIIITTEKDAVKLRNINDLPLSFTNNIYYLPIRVKFLFGKKEEFEKVIFEFVRNY
jgi:tetraacyldisaccharide 4'-kinase